MRILHVTASYLPAVRYGGPIHSVHGLCRTLVEQGHQVDVFTTRADGARDLPVEAGRRQEIDGVGVYYFDVGAPRRWFRSAALSTALDRRVSDYDVVHAHALFLHPVSAAAHHARRAGVPYVVSPRGMLVPSLFRQRSTLLKRSWLSLIGRSVLEQAAAIHVTSAREAADIAEFGLALPRVVEVPNGVALAPVSDVEREPGHIVFIGRLSWKKGLDRLLRALPLLPECRLTVAGNDEEGLSGDLQSLAGSLGIGDRVRFLGAVAPQRRDALLAQATVFVLASHSENFANTVLEAMAASCPVVVTPEVGLARQVHDHGCGLVSDAAPERLASAIASVVDDPGTARRMGERGRDVVAREFQWPRVASAMCDAYHALVAEAA